MSVKKTITAFLTAALILCLSLPFSASAEDLSFDVSYDARCGAPTTFTLNASGGAGGYKYLLNAVWVNGREDVVAPDWLPGYQEGNTFQFTFYASGVYTLRFYVMDSTFDHARKDVTVRISDPAYPSAEEIADKVAAQCRASCHTEYDRALWLHDWLLDHCKYDHSYLYCGPEGALARGTGTCEAYHRAYVMLLDRVGIASGRIEGNGHVWTAVRIDGSWYQVDVTWDDNESVTYAYEKYLYFGMNDAITTLVHSDHRPRAGYESNSLAQHYLIKTGGIRRWSDPLAEQLQSKLDAGQTSFTLPKPNDSYANMWRYDKVLYNLAAYQLSSQSWSSSGKPVKVQASYSGDQIKVTATYTSTPATPDKTPGTSTGSTGSRPSGTTSGSAGSRPSGTISGSTGSRPSGTTSGSTGSRPSGTTSGSTGSRPTGTISGGTASSLIGMISQIGAEIVGNQQPEEGVSGGSGEELTDLSSFESSETGETGSGEKGDAGSVEGSASHAGSADSGTVAGPGPAKDENLNTALIYVIAALLLFALASGGVLAVRKIKKRRANSEEEEKNGESGPTE